MPTLQDEQAQRQVLRTALAEIDLLKPDDLRRTDLPSELNFDEGLPFFERTWRLFRDVATLDLDLASYSLLTRLNQVAQQTQNQFRQIQSFNPQAFGTSQSARAQRDALITQIRDFYDGVFDQVMAARAYLGRPATDATHVTEDVRRIVSRAEKLAAETQATLSEKIATADRILETLRTSAATVGIAQFAGKFEVEAKTYKNAADGWLIATILLAVCDDSVRGLEFSVYPGPRSKLDNADGGTADRVEIDHLLRAGFRTRVVRPHLPRKPPQLCVEQAPSDCA